MRLTIAVLAAATVVSACASFNKQELDTKSVSAIKNQTVTYTARKKPDFAAATATKAAFAMLGAIAMISEGNRIVAENNIADPADAIAEGLAKELERAYGTRLITPPIMVDAEGANEVAARVNGVARFALDVQTINWSFGYSPINWVRYRVFYTAKVRLIDTQTKSVVAESFCKHTPYSETNASTYDELLDNGAARLKSELSAIANECVNSMKAQMLSL